jgi:hypothetical protein
VSPLQAAMADAVPAASAMAAAAAIFVKLFM